MRAPPLRPITRSPRRQRSPAPGWDRFYFNKDDNLLTTAHDRSDLRVWSENVPGGNDIGAFEGWQASEGRHRYQAMRLWTE